MGISNISRRDSENGSDPTLDLPFWVAEPENTHTLIVIHVDKQGHSGLWASVHDDEPIDSDATVIRVMGSALTALKQSRPPTRS